MKNKKDKKIKNKKPKKNLFPLIMAWLMLLIMVGGIVASILMYFVN